MGDVEADGLAPRCGDARGRLTAYEVRGAGARPPRDGRRESADQPSAAYDG